MATQLKNLVGYASMRDSISDAYSNPGITLVAEKLDEWEVFQHFLTHNPEIKEKYEVFKTYEILKNDA